MQKAVETWVIIIKLKHGQVIEKDTVNPVLGHFGLPIRERIRVPREEVEVQRFPIDRPMILIPQGNGIEKIEIIPITRPLVIHTQNKRRRIFP